MPTPLLSKEEKELLHAIGKINLNAEKEVVNSEARQLDREACIAIVRRAITDPAVFDAVLAELTKRADCKKHRLDAFIFADIVQRADFSQLSRLEIIQILRNPYDLSKIARAIGAQDIPDVWKEEVMAIALLHYRKEILDKCTWEVAPDTLEV